jgi:hypothetical protein
MDTITYRYGLNSSLKPLDPETATDAFPGSEEKIRVMEERYLRGEAIFHCMDCNDRTAREHRYMPDGITTYVAPMFPLAQPASESVSFGRG